MATTVINLSSLDGNNGFRLDGAVADYSGESVSNADFSAALEMTVSFKRNPSPYSGPPAALPHH